MARRYSFVDALAREISSKRRQRGLSFVKLGKVAMVDGAQVYRICRGDFKTLNPSVLKICNALDIRPRSEGLAVPHVQPGQHAAMLSAEVIAAWDQTEPGARKLQRILRALRS